ncbi:MAG: hypothetical protein ABIC40_01415, partial [bacterium]
MQDFRSAARIIILSLILVCGCSHGDSNPIAPSDSSTGLSEAQITPGTNESGTHVPWGIFDLAFDPATNEMKAIENREILGHLNVTKFMQPPNCSTCLVFQVLGVDPKIFHLKATIYNPFPKISGYDPRLIMDAGVSGYGLSDPDTGLPDGYTELWNTWGETRNPFIAFAKDQPQRKVLPLSSHTRIFDVSYTDVAGGFKIKDIRIILDACTPVNCPEPY